MGLVLGPILKWVNPEQFRTQRTSIRPGMYWHTTCSTP